MDAKKIIRLLTWTILILFGGCCNSWANDVITIWEAGTVWVDPGATALDNVDGDITAKIIVTGTVNVAALGTYVITYNVKDAAGNPAKVATRTVRVVDTKPPIITLKP
jgi:hypothetical protein